MNNHSLKAGGTWVKFGDVVKLNTDRCADPVAEGIERYVGLEHIEPEDLRIRRWGLVAEGTTFTNRFKHGQVLFGKRRAYLRKVAVADFEGICSSDIYVFEPKNDRLLPELLPFLCQTESFSAHAVGTSAGSLSPRTNWTQLANYEFALPPLEEQKRIAELLWAYQKVHIALADSKQSMEALLVPFLDKLMDVQSNQKKILLGEVVKIHIDRVSLESGKTYQLSGVLGFGQGLFSSGQIDIKSTKYRFLHRLSTNQLVLRKITAWESPIAIVTPEFDGTFASPEFPTFKLNQSKILPSYMSVLYRTPSFMREMQSRCTGTLVRRMRLNPKELLSIPVAIPTIDEQKQIVERFDAFLKGIKEFENRSELLRTARTKQLQKSLEYLE